MQKAYIGPGQIKSFRNNYLALAIATALLLITSVCSAQSVAPYDSTKNRQVQSSYGFDYGNITVGTLRIPRDTVKMAVKDSGSIAYKRGAVYVWSGRVWLLVSGTSVILNPAPGIDSIRFTRNTVCVYPHDQAAECYEWLSFPTGAHISDDSARYVYTNSRGDSIFSLPTKLVNAIGKGGIDITYGGIGANGLPNINYTLSKDSVRSFFSVTGSGGSYNATTGVFTITGGAGVSGISKLGSPAYGLTRTNDSTYIADTAVLTSQTRTTAGLALKADKSVTITPSTPLTGGGDLSANRSIGIDTTSGTATSAVTQYQRKKTSDSLLALINLKEPALGNPSTNGYVLSSTTGGTRSWIAPAAGGTTNVDSTIRAKNVLGFAAANAFGDSYPFGTGVAPAQAIFNLVAAKYGFTLTNYSQPGTGINQLSWQNYKNNAAFNITIPTFSLYAFNDVRGVIDQTKMLAKAENGYRANIANQFLDSARAANDASLTKTGTWSTQDTWTLYGGKAKWITSGGLGQKTSTANDQITYATTKDVIVVGFIGTVSTANTFSIAVNGSVLDTINTANRTDGFAVTNDSTTGTGISCVYIRSGLGTSNKTVTIKNISGQVIIDYIGSLKTDYTTCAPFFVSSIQKIMPAGWDLGSAIYKGSNKLVDLANERIKSVISEFRAINKNYPVYYVDINKYIYPATDYQADSLHWTVQGHQRAASAYIDFLNRPLSTYFAIDQPQNPDAQLPGYVAKDYLNNLNYGFGSLLKITTGDFNIAMGHRVLANTTTGYQNVGIGGSTLIANTTGATNTGIGHGVLQANTTGSGATAGGVRSMAANTTGNLSTAWGSNSLQANTTGSQNTGIGANALFSNIGGGLNTAVGESAAYGNTSGIWNVAGGVIALYNNSTGSNNTALGTIALYGTLASGNVGIGTEAGRANTTGTNNTWIGNEAGYASGSGQTNNLTNSTAIGYNAVTTLSNSFVFGSGISNYFFPSGKINLSTAANQSVGTATLVAGTVTVNTTLVATASKVFITVVTPGGTQGFLSVPTIVNGTSFTINSTSASETSTVNWWIIN